MEQIGNILVKDHPWVFITSCDSCREAILNSSSLINILAKQYSTAYNLIWKESWLFQALKAILGKGYVSGGWDKHAVLVHHLIAKSIECRSLDGVVLIWRVPMRSCWNLTMADSWWGQQERRRVTYIDWSLTAAREKWRTNLIRTVDPLALKLQHISGDAWSEW